MKLSEYKSQKMLDPAFAAAYAEVWKENKMNPLDRFNLLVDRYNRLSANPKNWKCPGVVRKLHRQIRRFNFEKF